MTTKANRGRPITTGTTPLRSIRVSDAKWARWREAARRSGQRSITAWLHFLADKHDTESEKCIDTIAADDTITTLSRDSLSPEQLTCSPDAHESARP